jgi:hypothetical protein
MFLFSVLPASLDDLTNEELGCMLRRHLEVVQLAQEGFNKLEEVQKSTLPSIKDAPSILKDLKKDISDALNMHVKIKAAEKLDGQQQAEALLGMLGLPPKATLSQMNKEMVRWSLRLHSDKLQPLLADAKLPAIAKVNALEVYQLLRGMFETVKKHLFPAEQLVLTPVDHLKVTSGEDEHGRRFMELTYGSLDDEEVRRGTAIVVDIPDPFPRDEPALHELLPLEDEDCTSALRIYEEDYSWLFVPAVSPTDYFRLVVYKICNGDEGPVQEVVVQDMVQDIEDSEEAENESYVSLDELKRRFSKLAMDVDVDQISTTTGFSGKPLKRRRGGRKVIGSARCGTWSDSLKRWKNG